MLAIVSCGGNSNKHDVCVDGDSDGICDVCDKTMPEEEVADLPLFEDGEPTFQIVIGKSEPNTVKHAAKSSIQETLKDKYDVDVYLFTEGSDDDANMDIEILIGNVTSRGEKYFFDEHTLGKEGYVIKIVGEKIIIDGGSEEAVIEAVELFAEEILGGDDITDLVMTKDDVVVEIQDDYKVTALKVSGTDMKGYTIATELTRTHYKDVALELQDSIYDKTGYWFDVVDIENATDKSIVIKHVDGITGSESYKVSTKGSQLVIACSYDNYLERATMQFATQKITTARGDVDFKDTVYTQDISVVYYDDFGAVGDGKTDDFFAIRNAHVFANESGQTVKASRTPSGKVYYIYDTRPTPQINNDTVSIPIQTTTDWQGVKFIIDDEDIPTFSVSGNAEHAARLALGKTNIFTITPNDEHKEFKFSNKDALNQIVAAGLNPDTKRIDLKIDGWDGSLMIVPYNSEHGVFRRKGAYGSLQSAGEDMHELIIIDKDGNVSEETPIMFEYTNIDYILVYKLDPSTAITVGNATIETIESRVQNKRFDENGKNLFSTAYILRGLGVSRSYTTVENITHVVSGGFSLKERANGYEAANYYGMFRSGSADHVTFRNCVLTGRQAYDGHSSYDFGAKGTNKIVLENCTQSNFWISVDSSDGSRIPSTEYTPGAYTSMSYVPMYNDSGELKNIKMCWGIGGTNYCKNMEYIGSQLSRFDAHQGLYNGKIIDSKINYLALTGYGEMIVENTDWYQPEHDLSFFELRSDYGYLWNGNLTAKNTRLHLYDITEVTPTLSIVGHGYSNFYFGYPTVFPNITLDNIDIYSTKNQAPVEAGYTLSIYNLYQKDVKMHLEGDAGKNAIFTYIDRDKDGFVDEPLFDSNMDGRINDADLIDFDGDGKVGNTSLVYADYAHLDIKEQNQGIIHPTCLRNLNPIRPPEYIKVINNDGVDGKGGYVYTVVDTSGQGISDGGWHRDKTAPDTMGGFFGGTKFYYGIEEDDYFVGTENKNGISETFAFKK